MKNIHATGLPLSFVKKRQNTNQHRKDEDSSNTLNKNAFRLFKRVGERCPSANKDIKQNPRVLEEDNKYPPTLHEKYSQDGCGIQFLGSRIERSSFNKKNHTKCSIDK